MAKEHPSRGLQERLPVIFTAHSRHTAFMKHHIIVFVLQQKRVPINPFASFEYFLIDAVERDVVRQGNNTLVQAADELWTFGIVADGVAEEIRLARRLGKPVRHFSLGTTIDSIREIAAGELEYEPGAARIDVLED
jgi:hypothetical protein